MGLLDFLLNPISLLASSFIECIASGMVGAGSLIELLILFAAFFIHTNDRMFFSLFFFFSSHPHWFIDK